MVSQPLLPCSEEGQGSAPHFGSVSPEFFPLQREIQDADAENYLGTDQSRGLVRYHGTKGRLNGMHYSSINIQGLS